MSNILEAGQLGSRFVLSSGQRRTLEKDCSEYSCRQYKTSADHCRGRRSRSSARAGRRSHDNSRHYRDSESYRSRCKASSMSPRRSCHQDGKSRRRSPSKRREERKTARDIGRDKPSASKENAWQTCSELKYRPSRNYSRSSRHSDADAVRESSRSRDRRRRTISHQHDSESSSRREGEECRRSSSGRSRSKYHHRRRKDSMEWRELNFDDKTTEVSTFLQKAHNGGDAMDRHRHVPRTSSAPSVETATVHPPCLSRTISAPTTSIAKKLFPGIARNASEIGDAVCITECLRLVDCSIRQMTTSNAY